MPDHAGSSWVWKEFAFYSKYSRKPLEDGKLMKRELRKPQGHNISKGIICFQIQQTCIEYLFARYSSKHFHIPFNSYQRPVRAVLISALSLSY